VYCHADPPPPGVRARHSADQNQPSSSTPGVKRQKRGSRSSSCALVDPSLESKASSRAIRPTQDLGSLTARKWPPEEKRRGGRTTQQQLLCFCTRLSYRRFIGIYINSFGPLLLLLTSVFTRRCIPACIPAWRREDFFFSPYRIVKSQPLLISRQNSIFGATHSGNHEVNWRTSLVSVFLAGHLFVTSVCRCVCLTLSLSLSLVPISYLFCATKSTCSSSLIIDYL